MRDPSHLSDTSEESLAQLGLDSTLRELSLYDFQIEIGCPGKQLARTFEENPLIPGAILVRGGEFAGMVSRRRFLEIMSRPYAIELFSRRSLASLQGFVATEVLVRSGNTPIVAAARECLQRPPELLYEPVVVELRPDVYQLLDVHQLLVAQSRLHELATLLLQERGQELDRANAEITSLNEQLQAENIRLSAELDVTRRLQQMLLPKETELLQIPGLEIAGFMQPADEVGGDYYDVLNHDGRIKIGIGDVTGHGLESGVLMIMVQTAVRTLLANNETDPVRFLTALNRTIYENVQRMNSDKNMTLSLLDYKENRMHLSGQHEEAIVIRSGGEIELIDTLDLGFPIGLDEDIAEFIAQTSVQLNPGDTVVLYTDGITEAEDENKNLYGLERLCKVLKTNWYKSAEEIRKAAIEDVQEHIGNHKVYDDITLLVLKQKGVEAMEAV